MSFLSQIGIKVIAQDVNHMAALVNYGFHYQIIGIDTLLRILMYYGIQQTSSRK